MKPTRGLSRLSAAILSAALALSAGAQRSGPATGGVAGLAARLETLDATDAMAYFDLGEEVAFEIASAEGQRLARELYVLAYSINDETREYPELARSACLALADLATEGDERRWLLALASTVRMDDERPSWRIERAQLGADDALLEVAQLLGDARRYENQRVRRGLARLAIEQMLLEGGVPGDDARAILAELVIASSEPPRCPECRNDRVTRTRSGGTTTVELCDRCGGNPGAEMNAQHFLAHMRAEGVLLQAAPATWAGQMLISKSRPLRDINPDDLAAHFEVDPERRTWIPGGGQAQPGAVPDGEWGHAEAEAGN